MRRFLDHVLLVLAVLVFCGPVVWVFVSAFAPGAAGANWEILTRQLSAEANGPGLTRMVYVSFALATGVSVLTTALSFMGAYAMTLFNRPLLNLGFWLTVATLYFPIEARMLHTFDVIAILGLTSSLPGLVLPILQLALGTLFFRQHLKRLPQALLEAARLDAAGPVRCLLEIVLPLSWSAIGTVALVTFIIGWNQYLWPLMASVDDNHWTLVRGLERVRAGSGAGLMLAALSLFPPLITVLLFRHSMSLTALSGRS